MPNSDPGLMTIFGEALEQADPAARSAYLDRACGGDADLRRRVEALLAAHASAGRFLEPDRADSLEPTIKAPPGTTVTFAPDAHRLAGKITEEHSPDPATATFDGTPRGHAAGAVLGTVVAGRYTLVEVIGEGGMGTVYRADQTEPVKRQVALKLIKAGMDSRVVLARFDAERQALALMDHPNIARVYDGGTTAGQPFFVMEIVTGVPITEYCDRQRLPIRVRLELFVSVCHAVQHAHQKGIIHRDIKPGNVLVTEVDGRPTPKVIDFGVAKATEQKLTDESFADTGAVVGTPAYMSPEQADPSSMDIDTRTDVYALGVLLYELLVGSPPISAKQFKRGAILEMLRMVREVEPPNPSTKLSTTEALANIAANRHIEPAQLKRALQGDLDWIVMKSLEKDRTRRYDTANSFAADILRHLSNEPVLAAPPSRAYRIRKLLRRHRGPVTAGLVVLIVLVSGIIGTSLGMLEARSAQHRADAEATNAKIQEEIAQGKAAEAEKQTGIAKVKAELAEQRTRELADEVRKTGQARDNALLILARQEFDTHNVTLARDRLGAIDPVNRGWEWNYLQRTMTSGGLFTLFGHSDQVTSASYSPDGRFIMTASQDWTVRLWDARTGEQRLAFVAGFVYCAAFTPDGTKIVTGTHDKIAKLWDARTGALLREFKGHTAPVWNIAVSPDGNRILTGGLDNTVRVWDAWTGRSLIELKDHAGRSGVAFSPDGSCFVTSVTGGLSRVLSTTTGQPLLTLKTSGRVDCVAYSPDGTRIVTGSMDGTATIWDARDGTKGLELFGRSGMVVSVAWSPDGSRIVTANSDGTARVWNARSGLLTIELKGHSHYVLAASFSPDGTRIVTGSLDHTAQVWDARSGGPIVQFTGHTPAVVTAVVSPVGGWAVSGGSDSKARIWDLATGRQLLVLEGHTGQIDSVAVSHDGSRIVTGSWDRTARIWNASTGQPLLALPGHRTRASMVWISPDNKRVVTCDDDSVARVWNATTGEKILEVKTPSRYVCVSYDPPTEQTTVAYLVLGVRRIDLKDAVTGRVIPQIDGFTSIAPQASLHSATGRLVTVAGSGAQLWDAKTGESFYLLKGHTRLVSSVLFTPAGDRVLTAASDGVIRCWDTRTGQPLLELKGYGSVNHIALSPEGDRVVACSIAAGAIVWDARPLSPRVELRGHTQPIKFAAYSLDGSRIATGSFDYTLRLWNAQTGNSELELKGHTGGVYCIAFTSDGTRMLTGSSDKTARLWNARTGELLVEFQGHNDIIESVAISPDGSQVITGSSGIFSKSAWVWDARTGRQLRELKGHTGGIRSVAWSTDGATIRTISYDANEELFWSARDGEQIRNPKTDFPPAPSPLSADGRFFAHNCGDFVQVIPLALSDEGRADRLWWTRVRPEQYLTAYNVAVRTKDTFATQFYLDRLLSMPMERTTARFRDRNNLKADPITIARTSFHHPALAKALYDRSIVQMMAVQGDHLAMRLVAQESLREGKPGQAIPMLFACLLSRPVLSPPVEEFLLAQACLDLNQLDEATRFYRVAAEWLDRPGQSVRAATMISQSALNPWAGVVAAFAPVDDPRRNAFDWESWHECDVFRADIERRLVGKP